MSIEQLSYREQLERLANRGCEGIDLAELVQMIKDQQQKKPD